MESRANKGIFEYPSGGTAKEFGGAVGVRAGKDSGQSNSQSRDVSQGIEVGGTGSVANPKAFLSGGFEAGVIPFAFGSQGISSLERKTTAVNRKSVV